MEINNTFSKQYFSQKIDICIILMGIAIMILTKTNKQFKLFQKLF